MRRTLVLATAAGVVAATAAIAGPALAATGPGPGPGNGGGRSGVSTCPMTGQPVSGQARGGRGPGGAGMGMGAGMGAGRGMRGGSVVDPLAGLAKGTLTDAQKVELAGMAEEEKLAHDVYVALAAKTGDARFTRISTAETRHLTEVRALLTRYEVADPTAGKAAGTFATVAVQKQYTDLVARGSASLDAALAVGRDVEKADIAGLAKARTGVSAPDVLAVFDRLTRASQMHLRAFGG